MSYNYDYNMKYTDNPYIDLLVHNTKIMGINSVVKNEGEALKYETLESRTASNTMISYKEGRPVDPYFVPENYIEKNRYYRTLSGQPPFPTKEEILLYQKEHGETANLNPLYYSKYILLTDYQSYIGKENYIDITGRFLHEFTNDTVTISMLESFGIIDQIKQDYPGDDFKYVYHLGEKVIDPYTARTAENFSLLYVPTIPFEDIFNKYKRVFDKNRRYTTSVIYSEAYAYGSLHYDNFIMILIIIQTMIDMISEVQEYIINKDVFDSRTIRYLFESYGIAYYKEIPVKYQLAMIKNVNTLLKYKSTNKNIVDICSLFGFPDINVFTYYILKTKKVNKENFSFYTKDDINPKYLDGVTYYLNDIQTTNNRYPLTDTVSNPMIRSVDTNETIGWIDSGFVLSQYPEEDFIIGSPILLNKTTPIYNDPIIENIVTDDMIGTEKFIDNYDLKFLRVPILEPNASDYMNDTSARRSYDYITNQDPFWDGVSKTDILTEEEKSKHHLYKKAEIISKEFSCERTKYISVDVAIDVCKMSYQLSYFMNILYDKHIDEEKLMLDVDSNMFDSGNTRVRLNDIMTLAIALSYLYNGVEPDTISTDMEKNMTINGFNFDTDWNDIYNNLNNNIFIRDENGDKMKISGTGFLVELDSEKPYEVGAYLSGRYKNDSGDYTSIIWDQIQNKKIFDMNTTYPSYTFDGFNGLDYPTYLEPALEIGAYDEDRIGEEDGYTYHYIDISWDTPYEPSQNSKGNFINTDILNELDDSASDMERYDKLKEIYMTNTNLYDHITYMMRNAESKRMYDIYNTLYESFMETKLSNDYYIIKDNNDNIVYTDSSDIKWLYSNNTSYTKTDDDNVSTTVSTPNGYYYNDTDDSIVLADTNKIPVSDSNLKPKVADDYYEYLQSRNPDMGGVLWKAWHGFKSKDDQKTYISKICDYIVYALEKYFDSNDWKYIYNLIPTRNLEFIQKCILKVVIFFKSWKTQMLDQTVEYIFDDPNQNYVHILDDIILSTMHDLYDKLGPKDYHDFLISKSPREKIEILEKLDFNTYYIRPWVLDLLLSDKISCADLMEIITTTSYKESVNITDAINMNTYTI